MTELERLTLSTAFIAAVVTAGLALSLVPHVELVTLVVFSSGVLLGARGGAGVGALGMGIYHFANSRVYGFPPSPPYLVFQMAGMALVGGAGGWWRGWWMAGGVPQRRALVLLPVAGFVLTGIYHAILNMGSALIFAEPGASRTAYVLAGMAFSLGNMISNTVVFALAGPAAVHAVRRAARARGWWRTPAAALALVTLLASPALSQTLSQTPAGTPAGTLPDTSQAPTPADTTGGSVLWPDRPHGIAAQRGATGFTEGASFAGGELSRTVGPGVPPVLDRWALGWGRLSYRYDGMPLDGPVHGLGEVPDLPLAWASTWRERWTATGTAIEIDPPGTAGKPRSQISLTTGSLSRRTAEFGLFRAVGGVDLGIDFLDRTGADAVFLSEVDHSRLWVRAASRGDSRWSVDVSTGVMERVLYTGGSLEQESRRLQLSWRGPVAASPVRGVVQLRRQAVRDLGAAGDFGEVRFDGFSLLAEWTPDAGPVRHLRVRGDRDRRRGGLERESTVDGLRAELAGQGVAGAWSWGWEGSAGYQEPYGNTWSGAARLRLAGERGEASVAVSHEEDLPALVVGIDRPTPEFGMAEMLTAYERAQDPESRTGIRAEGIWGGTPVRLEAGSWWTSVWHYRLDSNPLWARGTFLTPAPYPSDQAEVLGAYGGLRVEPVRGFFGEGRFRVHDRDPREVPYLAAWMVDGALHWRRVWFRGSLDLDVMVGGTVVGPRVNSRGTEYVTSNLGYLEVRGVVGNGVVTLAWGNLSDAYLESDLLLEDFETPAPAAGLTFFLGLTMYLLD